MIRCVRTMSAVLTSSTGVFGSFAAYETRTMFVPSVSTLKRLRTVSRRRSGSDAASSAGFSEVASTTSRMKLSVLRS